MSDNPYAPPDPAASPTPERTPYGQRPAGPFGAPNGPPVPGTPPPGRGSGARGNSVRGVGALVVGLLAVTAALFGLAAATGSVSEDVYAALSSGMTGGALLGLTAVGLGVTARLVSVRGPRAGGAPPAGGVTSPGGLAGAGAVLGVLAMALVAATYLTARTDLDAYQACLRASITFAGDDQCDAQLTDALN